MRNKTVDISDRFLLTFQEAASYFGIGENKLRTLAAQGDPDWLLHNGKRTLIKKQKLEALLMQLENI